MFPQSHNNHTKDYHKSMIDSTSSYSVWNDFFLLAGIPNTVAHEYAVTFSQHRIRIDMLKEITKEILLDMNIKAMGDIIAILRHAKNLYTQDELTGVSKITAPPVTSTVIPSRQPVTNHIAQRTPISTSRTKPGISSLVGNKVQSRVSSDSGALLASSNNSTVHSSSNSKRSHSTLSNSLSKRLRPAEPMDSSHGGRNLPEKTLTVHYPSGSAIAKAQQRVFGNVGSSSTRGPAPIKSRLGFVEDGSRNRSDLSSNHHSNRSWSKDSTKRNNGSTPSRSSSNNSFSSGRRLETGRSSHVSRDHVDLTPARLKSTVFKRLGV